MDSHSRLHASSQGRICVILKALLNTQVAHTDVHLSLLVRYHYTLWDFSDALPRTHKEDEDHRMHSQKFLILSLGDGCCWCKEAQALPLWGYATGAGGGSTCWFVHELATSTKRHNRPLHNLHKRLRTLTLEHERAKKLHTTLQRLQARCVVVPSSSLKALSGATIAPGHGNETDCLYCIRRLSSQVQAILSDSVGLRQGLRC